MTDLEVPILRADQSMMPRGRATELDGLGAFAVVRKTQSELLLRRVNLTGSHNVETVSIRTVRDENARVLRLLAGQADITVNATSPALLPQLERSGNLAVSARPGANVTYLLVNNDRAPFTEASTRRALSLAIDRQAIIEHLLQNHAQVARWIFPATHWSSPPDLALPTYDTRAASLQLRGKGPVTLLTSPDRSRLTLARVVAQMLGDAGLLTQVIPLDLGVMLSRLDAGNYTLAILQIPELTEPNLLSWFFHPRSIPGEGTDGRNRARYRSARAAVLLDAAAASFDHDTRTRLYYELARVMMTDMPIVPLWHEDQIVVSAKRVLGFLPTAAGRWDALANTELH
jgi:peptide/nickel transport system substrate-binding protein